MRMLELKHILVTLSLYTPECPVAATVTILSIDNLQCLLQGYVVIVAVVYKFIHVVLLCLCVQAGDKITVLSQVSAEWVYGQLGTQKGQFPVTFVDHVPNNLPQYQPKERHEPQPKQVIGNFE